MAAMGASLFLFTLAISLLVALVPPVIQGQYKRAPTLVFLVLGAALLILGIIWQWLPEGSLTSSVTSAASDFRWWFGSLFLIPWIHFTVVSALAEVRKDNEIVALRNDVHAIALVLERFVLPRGISDRRQRALAERLKQFEPHEVEFVVVPDDNEAETFRGQLQWALERGGWTILATKNDASVQPGLSIQHTRPPGSDDKSLDKSNLDAVQVLQIVFGSAGVKFEGIVSASSDGVTKARTEIRVGRRLRDMQTDPVLR